MPASVTPKAERMQEARRLEAAGDLEAAASLYETVLRRDPTYADALSRLAVVRRAQGRHAEALRLLDRGLVHERRRADLHYIRGNCLMSLARLDDAVAAFRKALSLQPTLADAQNNLGAALAGLGKFDAAIAAYQTAIALAPESAGAAYNLGKAFLRTGQYNDALASFARAQRHAPASAALMLDRGVAQVHLADWNAAHVSFQAAVSIDPANALAWHNLGAVQSKLRLWPEAAQSSGRAHELDPENLEFKIGLALAFIDLNRLDAAVELLRRAIESAPTSVKAHIALGHALTKANRFRDAIQSFRAALELDGDNAEAHYNYALAELTLGNFVIGLPHYEWRWQTEQFAPLRRSFDGPAWLGAPDVRGKTLLVHAEQGFGDTIQFSRFLEPISAAGGRLVFEVPVPLQSLLSRALPNVELCTALEPPPAYDFHTPLLSLPLALGVSSPVAPSTMPYIVADASACEAWRARLRPGGACLIGFAWSGNPAHRNDHNRSAPLEAFRNLASLDGARFISLQKDTSAPENPASSKPAAWLEDYAEYVRDFSDTAALLSALDLVITVDTSTAHLAGALDLPVWIMLPFSPDWRWGLDRTDTAWYPRARLYRQKRPGDWDSVADAVVADLKAFIATRSGSTNG